MGSVTGFLDIRRKDDRAEAAESRVRHFREFHIPMEEADRREQAARCKDCGVPFCQLDAGAPGLVSGCPLGNLIPEWNDFLHRGNDRQALHRLLKTNNFPEFTSRVCPAPCEAACTGNLTGLPVANRENEKYLAEFGFSAGLMGPEAPAVRSGKRVAVIGSGPAGLAAADQLNHRGHSVTVFERDDRPGGLLMYGIPNMKLDKGIVARRIRLMEQEGVTFCTGQEISAKEQAEELRRAYDAVILAVGARKPRDVEAPGRDAAGIFFALDYLAAATRQLLDSGVRVPAELGARGKRVLVIGGGDTGTDCVATALRQGCKKVVQMIRRPKPPLQRTQDNPWPQLPVVLKTDYGQEEAAALTGKDPRVFGMRVREYLKNQEGRLTGVTAVRLEEKTDEAGKKVLTEVAGSETKLPFDMVLIAAGYEGPEPALAEAFGLKLNGRGNLAEEAVYGHGTSLPGVFAAGDCHRGQSLVVHAIREGREAAREAEQYMMGYTALP